MINLPRWRLTSKYPAFYDTESGSAIEQTARVYAAVQALIDEYNKFAEDIEKQFNDLKTDTDRDITEFKDCITKTMQEYTSTIDDKIIDFQRQINELILKIEVGVVYDEEKESLSLVATFNGGASNE